ncbi:MAG: 2OG-Fe(II) oxygenase [Rhodospirillales bacterium]
MEALTDMPILNLDSLRATPLAREPYEHVIVPGFVDAAALDRIEADFPPIDRPGSFPLDGLDCGPGFAALIEALRGPDCTAAFADKFGVDLAGRPTMVTVRGQAQLKDGRIHTDSKDKIITVLVYMNGPWDAEGGRLRILRSATDLEDYAAEVPPVRGTLLAFLRSDRSFHGHKPFVGQRRIIQLNWVTSDDVVKREKFRHGVSAWLKRLRRAA